MTPHDTLDEPRMVLSAEAGRVSNVRFPQTLLNVGFGFALAVAAACLTLSAWYLFTFLQATNSAVEGVLSNALSAPSTPTSVIHLSILARTAMARFALLSCGICVGMGFGFLGFALFLLGIKGEMDVEAQHEQAHIKVARMAPGVFVILCATILIGVCVTFRTQYEWGAGDAGNPAQPSRGDGAGVPGVPDNLPKLLPDERKP